MTLCHYVFMSLCHYVLLSLCQYGTMSLYHKSLCHYAPMLLYQYITMSLYHDITMSLCDVCTPWRPMRLSCWAMTAAQRSEGGTGTSLQVTAGMYCTVLYSTVLYITVLYITVLYSILQYCIVPYCTVLYWLLTVIQYYSIILHLWEVPAGAGAGRLPLSPRGPFQYQYNTVPAGTGTGL